MASHVFWNCPSARRHWNYLLERWRKLGDLTEADLHVWLFGMDLPRIPKFAWDAIRHVIDPDVDLSRAKDAVSPATHELWCFLDSTTIHSIGIERLRRLEVHLCHMRYMTSGNAVSKFNIPTGHGGRRTSVCTSTVVACYYSHLLQ